MAKTKESETKEVETKSVEVEDTQFYFVSPKSRSYSTSIIRGDKKEMVNFVEKRFSTNDKFIADELRATIKRYKDKNLEAPFMELSEFKKITAVEPEQVMIKHPATGEEVWVDVADLKANFIKDKFTQTDSESLLNTSKETVSGVRGAKETK